MSPLRRRTVLCRGCVRRISTVTRLHERSRACWEASNQTPPWPLRRQPTRPPTGRRAITELKYTNELLKENNLLMRTLLEHLQAKNVPTFVAEHPEAARVRKLEKARLAGFMRAS